MRQVFDPIRFQLRSSWILGGTVLFALLLLSFFALRGLAGLKTPETDYGQHLIRHMRYTYAELAALDSLLNALAADHVDDGSRQMLIDAADRMYVRLEMLGELKRGPISSPDSEVTHLANALMGGLDELIASGFPPEAEKLKALRAISGNMLVKTGDYTREIESQIDQMLMQRKKLAASARYQVLGSVGLLLALSILSVILFLRNRRMVRELRIANGRDSLTGLANRRGFSEWMQQMTARRSTPPHAILVFDLDRFKTVNDQYGHSIGDQLLTAAADCLVETFGKDGIVARWGGDEFVAAVRLGSQGLSDIERRLALLTSTPPVINSHGVVVPIGFSCGVAVWPDDATTPDGAMLRADAALYEAKEAGRGRFVIYHGEILERRKRDEVIRADLDGALSAGEFFLEYQPQYNLAEQAYVGVEALLRWKCGRTGAIIPPEDFIPIAEESEQILAIDTFVLNEACKAAASWQRIRGETLRVAVNLSPHSFQRIGLGAHILKILNNWQLSPSTLEIEITEGVLLSESERLMSNLSDLSALGIRIALDDFGTGYSNIAYLARLKPDLLKIDRSFLLEPNARTRASVVEGIIRLASSLGAETLVEGVETEDDLDFVRNAGSLYGQGFYFARPMRAEFIPDFLTKQAGRRGTSKPAASGIAGA